MMIRKIEREGSEKVEILQPLLVINILEQIGFTVTESFIHRLVLNQEWIAHELEVLEADKGDTLFANQVLTRVRQWLRNKHR